jgi:cysteine desulfuration protein SufE
MRSANTLKPDRTKSPDCTNPVPVHSMINVSLDRIERGFQVTPNWEDRYRVLIQLGRKLPAFPEALKDEAHRVQGCTSNVWLASELSDETPPRLTLLAESDAHIVKGLAALLLVIFQGKTPEEVLAVDARAILDRLDLQSHLSPNRSNGLFAMVERIRGHAALALAEEQSKPTP